jgi:hypothetical protein
MAAGRIADVRGLADAIAQTPNVEQRGGHHPDHRGEDDLYHVPK